MTKHHCPATLAGMHLRLSMALPVCEHGIDRWAVRGRTLAYTSLWVCGCCTLVFPGPSPEGMRCGTCSA